MTNSQAYGKMLLQLRNGSLILLLAGWRLLGPRNPIPAALGGLSLEDGCSMEGFARQQPPYFPPAPSPLFSFAVTHTAVPLRSFVSHSLTGRCGNQGDNDLSQE